MLTVVLQKPGQSFPVQHCSAGLLVMTCRSVKAGNCSKCLASASVDPEHEFELLAAQQLSMCSSHFQGWCGILIFDKYTYLASF